MTTVEQARDTEEKLRASGRAFSEVKQTAQAIAHVHDATGPALRADFLNITDAAAELGRIRHEMARAEARLRDNRKSLAQFELQLAPLLTAYEKGCDGLAGTYARAKAGHARGVAVLEKQLGYHPLYSKARPDEFHASPWKPK